jgi:indolepyruvate ferredoxin oxidoreductase alpha subunit
MKKDVLIQDVPGARVLALGNEAMARGAIEAGVQFVTGYPGTPSTEIMEVLIEAAAERGFRAYWSVNEKVAFDAATGASFSRARSMVVMKHVGMNVAADSLQQLKLIDVAGGFVVITVDDPGGVSSNNEQDNRWYARFAGLPALEPADLDDAREMTKRAFEISEELQVPVMLRSVTRLAHMSGDLELGTMEGGERAPYFDSSREWTPFPCQGPEQRLREKLRRAGEVLERYGFDRYEGTGKEEMGVVGAGFAFNYAQEAVDRLGLGEKVALVKISTVNPTPTQIIRRLLSHVEQVLVVEDVTPYLEEAIKVEAQEMGRRVRIYGRKSGALPETGETLLDEVEDALSEMVEGESPGDSVGRGDALVLGEREQQVRALEKLIPRRQMGFCAGCPHRATYYACIQALRRTGIDDPIVLGDIGCYALGFYPPFSILQTMTSMGASMGTAEALAQMNPERKVIAFIGDSTFYHSGMPGLLQIAHQQRPVLVVVMDNAVTASTGQQPHPGTWQVSAERTIVPIEDIARAYKIPHVRVVPSFQIGRLIKEMEAGLRLDAPAVIVSRQACALEAGERWRERRIVGRIDLGKCSGCLDCVEGFGCPAFVAAEEEGKLTIDPVLCIGCGACKPVCPQGAIYFERRDRSE